MIVAFPRGAGNGEAAGVGLAQEKQFGDILVRKAKSFDTVFDEKGELKQIDQEYQ